MIDALDRAGIPFMIVGSLASNFHGIPRATRDAHFVIRLDGPPIAALAAALPPDLRLEPQAAFETVTGTTRYLVTLRQSPFVCELFLCSDDPHDIARFDRRQRVRVLDRDAFMATAEDMIITKLRWAAEAGRTKDRDDIRNIIAVTRQRARLGLHRGVVYETRHARTAGPDSRVAAAGLTSDRPGGHTGQGLRAGEYRCSIRGMTFRCLTLGIVAFSLAACQPVAPAASPPTPFVLIEATIPQMQAAMAEGRLTSDDLVEMYLARIGTYQRLHAAIYVNPHALADADARDRERAAGKVRGPLHGIPIALKDNIHTTDTPTSGGALAFDGFIPPYEATLTKNLVEAGAVIIAKAAMSELAGYTAGAPTPAPGGYSATGGQGFNPYDPRRDPRPATSDGRPAMTPAGSSSGAGTAANLWAANIGTETSGSILGPSNVAMLAAVKPTVGRVSRWGVIPITSDQDTAGPMARTVTDAAILLGALEGASPDPNDAATSRCQPPPGRDYTTFLDANALRGARIGIPRAFYYDRITPPGGKEPRGGLDAAQATAMTEAIEILKAQGAVIVDPADVPSVVATDPALNIVDWNFCGGASDVRGKDAGCTIVVKYGMKRDFNKWLATLGPTAPVKTLTELREWNRAHEKGGAIRYGQSRLDISDEVDLEKDRPRYEADQKKDLALTTTSGIDAVMAQHKLDAILFPGSSGAGLSARPGYPTVIVPFARVPNQPTPPFPDGFDARPQPFGVSFAGLACSEPKLLGLAFAFEQATKRRVPPEATP